MKRLHTGSTSVKVFIDRLTYHVTRPNEMALVYNAKMRTFSNYYPFGMEQFKRRYSSGQNRFGFNGAEKDEEMFEGSYDLGLRNYDSRLGRMFSPDPRENEYPWQSTYAYYANSPVSTIDYLGGGCPTCPTDGEEGDIYYETNGKPFTAPDGQQMSGTDGSGFSVFSSEDLSSIAYVNGGDAGWLAMGFKTKSGDVYTWSQDAQWYVDGDGEEFDDHTSFDMTNWVSGSMTPLVQAAIDKVQSGDALKTIKEAYAASGNSSWLGFFADGMAQMGEDLMAGGHRGTRAWGGLYTGMLSSGPMVPLGVGDFGLGSGMFGRISKSALGLPFVKGASKSLNYFTALAYKNFSRGNFLKPKIKAPLLVQMNHNIFSGKMFKVGWEKMYSLTPGTHWARTMQSGYMKSGLLMVGAGSTQFSSITLSNSFYYTGNGGN